jgi:hypothetical protein
MKTAEDKATTATIMILSRLVMYGISNEDAKFVSEHIMRLLKEQDRDTRHACAVAVNGMEGDFKLISQAYNIIMNTKVV